MLCNPDVKDPEISDAAYVVRCLELSDTVHCQDPGSRPVLNGAHTAYVQKSRDPSDNTDMSDNELQ